MKKIKNNENESGIKDVHVYGLILITGLIYTFNLWSRPNQASVGFDSGSLIVDAPYYFQSIFHFGQIPMWNDLWFLGFPQYASPLSNFYYPVNTLIYLVFGLMYGYNIIVTVHIVLSGFGFWLFSKLLTDNKIARLYGVMVWMLSGAVAARVIGGQLPIIMALAYIPFLMYFFMKAVDTRQTKYICLSGIFLGLMFIIGHPYFFVFGLMTMVVMTVVDKKSFLILIGIVVVAIGTSGIVAIPEIVNSGYLIRGVDPMGGIMKFSDILTSLIVTDTNDFGTKYMWGYDEKWNWENFYYVGVIPLIFAGVGMIIPSRYRLMIISGLMMSVIYVQGSFTNLGIIHYLPFVDKLRVAERTIGLVVFFIAVMSVVGFDWWMKNRKGVGWVVMVFGVLTGLEFLKMFTSGFEGEKTMVIAKTLIIVAVVGVVLEKFVDRKANVVFMFTVLSLVMINGQLVTPSVPSPFVPTESGDNVKIQKMWEPLKSEPPSTVEGVGNGGLNDFIGLSMNEQRIRYYNMGYGYGYKYMPKEIIIGGKNYSTIDKRVNYGVLREIGVVEMNNSLPFAFSVKDGVVRSLEVKKYTPNGFVVGESDGDIVVKNGYHHGWKVDGLTVENYQGLISVKSDGRKEYKFVFDPWDFWVGLLVSLGSWIGCIVVYKYDKKI